jgi:hypothetical protein
MRRALALLTALASPAVASAAEVAAAAPRDVSVTIYRNPHRGSGGIDLDELGGFALVTETRDVTLPAGESRLRFEGVADGIDPASAIVTGLPSGVIEKNRDAHLLSPSALIAASLGKKVMLIRTDRKTGKSTETAGTIRSDAEGGVVFETAEGVEALRCSGLSETFSFDPAVSAVPARPTLSVLTRSGAPVHATVTLSYLARNFDWAADYTATLSPDGKSIDLGAWVTLANGNGTGFPNSHAQVVAGRLNRKSGEVEPIDMGTPVLAKCWPQGSTSDIPTAPSIVRATPLILGYPESILVAAKRTMSLNAAMPVAASVPMMVEQEQLGDLKLYRVPERTTVASRQSKQVRLLDRESVPVDRIYEADYQAGATFSYAPAQTLLRTKNDAAHRLGLPLPSGTVAVFAPRGGGSLLLGEAALKDRTLDEEVELRYGESPDVQVRQIQEERNIDTEHAKDLPLLPGITLRSTKISSVSRVEIANARETPIRFELRLYLGDGYRVVRADHAMAMKDGRPIFRLDVPANGEAAIRYQTESPNP